MVGNILVKNGGVESKWKSNFDWRNETNQHEMNIGKYVERTKNENVQTKTTKFFKMGNK